MVLIDVLFKFLSPRRCAFLLLITGAFIGITLKSAANAHIKVHRHAGPEKEDLILFSKELFNYISISHYENGKPIPLSGEVIREKLTLLGKYFVNKLKLNPKVIVKIEELHKGKPLAVSGHNQSRIQPQSMESQAMRGGNYYTPMNEEVRTGEHSDPEFSNIFSKSPQRTTTKSAAPTNPLSKFAGDVKTKIKKGVKKIKKLLKSNSPKSAEKYVVTNGAEASKPMNTIPDKPAAKDDEKDQNVHVTVNITTPNTPQATQTAFTLPQELGFLKAFFTQSAPQQTIPTTPTMPAATTTPSTTTSNNPATVSPNISITNTSPVTIEHQDTPVQTPTKEPEHEEKNDAGPKEEVAPEPEKPLLITLPEITPGFNLDVLEGGLKKLDTTIADKTRSHLYNLLQSDERLLSNIINDFTPITTTLTGMAKNLLLISCHETLKTVENRKWNQGNFTDNDLKELQKGANKLLNSFVGHIETLISIGAKANDREQFRLFSIANYDSNNSAKKSVLDLNVTLLPILQNPYLLALLAHENLLYRFLSTIKAVFLPPFLPILNLTSFVEPTTTTQTAGQIILSSPQNNYAQQVNSLVEHLNSTARYLNKFDQKTKSLAVSAFLVSLYKYDNPGSASATFTPKLLQNLGFKEKFNKDPMYVIDDAALAQKIKTNFDQEINGYGTIIFRDFLRDVLAESIATVVIDAARIFIPFVNTSSLGIRDADTKYQVITLLRNLIEFKNNNFLNKLESTTLDSLKNWYQKGMSKFNVKSRIATNLSEFEVLSCIAQAKSLISVIPNPAKYAGSIDALMPIFATANNGIKPLPSGVVIFDNTTPLFISAPTITLLYETIEAQYRKAFKGLIVGGFLSRQDPNFAPTFKKLLEAINSNTNFKTRLQNNFSSYLTMINNMVTGLGVFTNLNTVATPSALPTTTATAPGTTQIFIGPLPQQQYATSR